jgi:hypothetical protein
MGDGLKCHDWSTVNALYWGDWAWSERTNEVEAGILTKNKYENDEPEVEAREQGWPSHTPSAYR